MIFSAATSMVPIFIVALKDLETAAAQMRKMKVMTRGIGRNDAICETDDDCIRAYFCNSNKRC